ncbi:MAG: hypothetical protein KIS68_03730 [Bauldia sp.]|nr:hypothetical protein [Bauldia sp.]
MRTAFEGDSLTKRWRPASPPAKMKKTFGETTMTLHGQFDLFAEPTPAAGVAPGERPDAGRVRARLLGLLSEARSATAMPWPAAKARLYETIFPQMARWLPDAEAVSLRGAFETELARLRKGNGAAEAA